MPSIMPAVHAIMYHAVFMNPNPAVNSRHKIPVAVLAYASLQFRRELYLVSHCNPPCKLHVFVRLFDIFFERVFGFIKKELNPALRHFHLLVWLFVVFFAGHFRIKITAQYKIILKSRSKVKQTAAQEQV